MKNRESKPQKRPIKHAVKSSSKRHSRHRRHRRRRERSSSRRERKAYERGLWDGMMEGRRMLLDESLSETMIIPDITPEEVMAAGIAAIGAVRGRPLMDTETVYNEIESALQEKRPYSFIRLGDGEMLTLAQERVLPDAEIRKIGVYLPYAGVKIPNLEARDELLAAMKTASLVGVPVSRQRYFQPLLLRNLKAYQIDFSALKITGSTMNYMLDDEGYWMRLLQGRRVLLIGNVAPELASVLAARGVQIAGVIHPVNGFADRGRVIAEAAAKDFDIALVSAGIAAVPICVRLMALTGKVTIDFGHLAERMCGIPMPFR